MQKTRSRQTFVAEVHADSHSRIEDWVHRKTTRIERIARILLSPFCDFVYRLKAFGPKPLVPDEGPFLLVANHASYMDPFLLVRSHRNVRFMAKSSLFDVPLLGSVVAGGGGFPVRRGQGDTFAMRLAQELLEDGQPVALFPEGTRIRETAELAPSRSGAARLALAAGVPVVPVAIYGNKPRSVREGKRSWLPKLPRVTTVYGEPITFEADADLETVRDEIWAQVNALYAEASEIDRMRFRRRTRYRA